MQNVGMNFNLLFLGGTPRIGTRQNYVVQKRRKYKKTRNYGIAVGDCLVVAVAPVVLVVAAVHSVSPRLQWRPNGRRSDGGSHRQPSKAGNVDLLNFFL